MIFIPFSMFTLFPKKVQKLKKSIIFKKSYVRDFKRFCNNFFCKKSLRFPSFKIAVARRNPSDLNFLQSFENKEKWAFWVQTSNGYISDKTCDFSIIFFTKNSPDYQQSNVWSPEKIRLKLIFLLIFKKKLAKPKPWLVSL